MNLIETIFNSIQKATMQFMGEIPNDIENYCIGSGSNFEIHKNITYSKAISLYKEYKQNLQTGKRHSKKEVARCIIEEFATMESTTGRTFTFMFRINKIIEHDPNECIEEFIETKRKKEELEKQLKEQIEKLNKREK